MFSIRDAAFVGTCRMENDPPQPPAKLPEQATSHFEKAMEKANEHRPDHAPHNP